MARIPDEVSAAGIALIGFYEGLENHVYLDSAGVATIGIGTTSATGRNIHMGMDPISDETAIEWFDEDLHKIYYPIIPKYVTVDLSQDHVDALASWCYNLGETNFASSTMLKVLNAGDYWNTLHEILRWDSSAGQTLRGLTRRRGSEAGFFQRGNVSLKIYREHGSVPPELPSIDVLKGE